MQGAHLTAAQIEIKKQIELAGRVLVPPDGCGRLLRALRRRAEQPCSRRLVETDQFAGIGRRRRGLSGGGGSGRRFVGGRRFGVSGCPPVASAASAPGGLRPLPGRRLRSAPVGRACAAAAAPPAGPRCSQAVAAARRIEAAPGNWGRLGRAGGERTHPEGQQWGREANLAALPASPLPRSASRRQHTIAQRRAKRSIAPISPSR